MTSKQIGASVRKPGRPATPEGPRKNIVKVSLNDKELEAIANVTNAPAQFMREAALKAVKFKP